VPQRRLKPVRTLDLTLAGLTGALGAVSLLRQAVRSRRRPRALPRTLIFFNSSYTLRRLRLRRNEHFLTHRDLNGFFEHVWSIHPLVGASPDEPVKAGRTRVIRLNANHTVIEAPISRSARLTALPLFGFALSQFALLREVQSLCSRRQIGIVRAVDPFYNGLLATLVARVNNLPLEVRVIANYDLAYEVAGQLAYPRLLRWRWLERAIARFTLAQADLVITGSDDNEAFALCNGASP